mmetsp:Transcript_20246/g.36057  ORF Transcript_20246/g.36057 Transcript_20246/m.36057 type:complete len:236 (-) Transcript_20246:2050-2757(-)
MMLDKHLVRLRLRILDLRHIRPLRICVHDIRLHVGLHLGSVNIHRLHLGCLCRVHLPSLGMHVGARVGMRHLAGSSCSVHGLGLSWLDANERVVNLLHSVCHVRAIGMLRVGGCVVGVCISMWGLEVVLRCPIALVLLLLLLLGLLALAVTIMVIIMLLVVLVLPVSVAAVPSAVAMTIRPALLVTVTTTMAAIIVVAAVVTRGAENLLWHLATSGQRAALGGNQALPLLADILP